MLLLLLLIFVLGSTAPASAADILDILLNVERDIGKLGLRISNELIALVPLIRLLVDKLIVRRRSRVLLAIIAI